LDSVGLRFFLDDVKSGIGSGLFGPSYRALDPSVKAQCFVCFFKKQLGWNPHLQSHDCFSSVCG